MELVLKKRAQKYLDSVDTNTYKKLIRALERLRQLDGDIKNLGGNRYRYKIEHYRILFEWNKGEIIITVIDIDTRSNIYRRR